MGLIRIGAIMGFIRQGIGKKTEREKGHYMVKKVTSYI